MLAGSTTAGPDLATLVIKGVDLTAADMLARRDVLLRHFDAYMDHMYWLPSQGCFHPKTAYCEIQEGIFNPIKAAAVCAITSCFIDPSQSGREFMRKCSQHIDFHLFQNIHRPSEDLLIVFALSITAQLIRGEFAMVWQGFGAALRLMVGLRANWEVIGNPKSFFQEEIIRRTAWHIFHVDRMLAGGYDEYISCRAEIMEISLPCAETNFLENDRITAERLSDGQGPRPGTTNLHAYQIRLIDLRHRIQAFFKHLNSSADMARKSFDASMLMSNIESLQAELTQYHKGLPSELLLTDESIAKYMRRPERAGFVWLHSHFYVSHIDLYRFALPRQRDKASTEILRRLPRDFLARAQRQAVAHAMALARFYDAIQTEVDNMPKSNMMMLAGDVSTFQISTPCVRVLLLALQFGLYKDLSDVPISELSLEIKPDETYMRYLIDAVQRVNMPWCDLLSIARQAVCILSTGNLLPFA